MSDFCKQCGVDIFGEGDCTDLAWGTWEEFKDSPHFTEDGKPYWVIFICEGCGNAVCLPDGTCISANCAEKHGLNHPHSVTFKE